MKKPTNPVDEWAHSAAGGAFSSELVALNENAHGAASRGHLWNPLRHPICLSSPHRSSAASAWTEHIPFAWVLVELLRPRIVVELGTHTGESYCAFCQAVHDLRLPARCYAVDTWRGDPQTGSYGPEVLAELRAHHDPVYGSFSRLIQSTFDEALEHFDDASIDLLHVDGFHTYEAVHHDFGSWLPKLSSSAVVLFHDTDVREKDFGVRRFWHEIRETYPSFDMPFGHGLGVLMVGKRVPAKFTRFVETKAKAPALVDSFFHRLGQSISQQTRSATTEAVLKNHIAERDAVFRHTTEALRKELQQAADRLLSLERCLAERQSEHASLNRRLQDALAEGSAVAAQRDHMAVLLQEKGVEVETLEERIVSLESARALLQAQLQRSQESVGKELESKDRVIQELFDILTEKDRALFEMRSSTAWSLVQGLRRLRTAIAPAGTNRERLWKKLAGVARGRLGAAKRCAERKRKALLSS